MSPIVVTNSSPSGRVRRVGGAVAAGTLNLSALPTLTSLNRLAPDHSRNASIRALAAGDTYVDDLSGVTVIKMTAASAPVANIGGTLAYSEGGPFISRAWGSRQHTVMTVVNVTSVGNRYYFHDISRSGGTAGRVSNARYRTFGNDELSFAFSMNPSTPKRGYVLNGTKLYAFDADDPQTNLDLTYIPSTGKDFAANIGGGTSLNWLSAIENDEWLTFQCESTSTAVAFSPSTGVTRTVTMPGGYALNQLHPEKRSGSTRVFLLSNTYKVTVTWNHSTGTTVTNTGLYGGHPAPMVDGYAEWNPDYDGTDGFLYAATANTISTQVAGVANNAYSGLHKSSHYINGTTSANAYFLDTAPTALTALAGDSLFGLGSWTVHSGNVYKSTITTAGALGGLAASIGIRQVIQGTAGTTVPSTFTHRLTEVASVGAVVEGSFFYDSGAKVLYVWANGGGTPALRVLPLAPNGAGLGIALYRGDASDARLVVPHRSHLNTPDNYQYFANPFGSQSPDGFCVGFTSNMGDSSARLDMYLALLPET